MTALQESDEKRRRHQRNPQNLRNPYSPTKIIFDALNLGRNYTDSARTVG